MEDRKRKGLCFWCGLKYTHRHKCVKSQLYQFMVETSLNVDCVEASAIKGSFDGAEQWELVELRQRVLLLFSSFML